MTRPATARRFADEHRAYLATGRGAGQYSLSPASLETLPPQARLVLPSPNGATLSLAARGHGIVLAGCLRNASAVAAACAAFGGRVAIIPAGERWPMGQLRPALEDLIGAGAIASHFDAARLSVEARAAVAVFDDARPGLQAALRKCRSGRELAELGYPRDVEVAAMLDASETVPRLEHDVFRHHPGGRTRTTG